MTRSGPAPAILGAIGRAFLPFFRAIAETYRRGFAVWRRAPLLVAIAAIPEFFQHIVEIGLGMFASLDAFRALQNDPLRWQLGYAKITGVVLALILVARYLGVGGSLRLSFLAPMTTTLRVLIAIGILIGSSWLLAPERLALSPSLDIARMIAGWLSSCGIVVWIVAILVGDSSITLRRAFTERFPAAIIILLLFLAAMLPAQFVHRIDHRIVLGQPIAIQWAIMAIDALVVGAMGTLGGSALYVGYCSGLTWRGWRPVGEQDATLAGSGSIVHSGPAANPSLSA